MRKLIAIIALLSALGMAGTAFAGGTAMTGATSGATVTAAETPAFNYNIVAAAQTATAQAQADNVLTFGLANFKLANPNLKVFKNVSLNVERMQDLGTFAAVDFNFKF